ncbi:MAG TPA: hypothetical protein VHO06_19795 [Polyangia bacterium]|nr:hypothetical protein [Polyangia bacterium]
MSKQTRSWSRTVIGCGGAGLAALLAAGCATESAGPLAASMTPEQYAQVAGEQCAGVPAKEQEQGILAYRDALSGAQPLKEPYQVGKVTLTHDRGVRIGVRAQPTLTGPWLERVATCHMALARAGRLAPNAGDPFAVAGATVRVEEAYTGYVVELRVSNADAATEVMDRATAALAAPAGPMTAEGAAR